jgi:hypothetical protein
MEAEDDFDSVLATISAWPAERRASLAHALIDSLTTAADRPNGQKPTIDQLVGIARGDAPPPTDEQVKQWLGEHRMRKYGT